jgi:hypothetical protein
VRAACFSRLHEQSLKFQLDVGVQGKDELLRVVQRKFWFRSLKQYFETLKLYMKSLKILICSSDFRLSFILKECKI